MSGTACNRPPAGGWAHLCCERVPRRQLPALDQWPRQKADGPLELTGPAVPASAASHGICPCCPAEAEPLAASTSEPGAEGVPCACPRCQVDLRLTKGAWHSLSGAFGQLRQLCISSGQHGTGGRGARHGALHCSRRPARANCVRYALPLTFTCSLSPCRRVYRHRGVRLKQVRRIVWAAAAPASFGCTQAARPVTLLQQL